MNRHDVPPPTQAEQSWFHTSTVLFCTTEDMFKFTGKSPHSCPCNNMRMDLPTHATTRSTDLPTVPIFYIGSTTFIAPSRLLTTSTTRKKPTTRKVYNDNTIESKSTASTTKITRTRKANDESIDRIRITFNQASVGRSVLKINTHIRRRKLRSSHPTTKPSITFPFDIDHGKD